MARLAGWRACANRMLRVRWPCCTATSPGHWTVDDLGREVGLSRSALADRFIQLIGVPPMHYLVSWRMQVATQKLRNTNASIAQVADLVGYDSEAAFSRAFKKALGVAPATWRRSNS